MSTFRIALSPPQHGWLPVRIQLDEDTLEFNASYVTDCIGALVYAALELTEHRPPRDVVFFGEPGGHRLAMSGDDADIEVSITQHATIPPTPTGANGMLAVTAVVPRLALAKAIWSSLHHLVTSIGMSEIEEGWQQAFPAKELAQLAARVTD